MHEMRRLLTLLEAPQARLGEMSRPGDRDDAISFLKKHGYEALGHGTYGSVLAKPGEPWVLKVFDARDRAYPAFINFVLAHPNKHFPRFKRGFIKVTSKYNAVRMERLTPLNELSGAVYEELVDMIDSYLTVKESNRRDYKMVHHDDYVPAAEALQEKEPSLCAALDLLDEGMLARGFLADINDENLAMRGGTVVLLDPVAGRAAVA